MGNYLPDPRRLRVLSSVPVGQDPLDAQDRSGLSLYSEGMVNWGTIPWSFATCVTSPRSPRKAHSVAQRKNYILRNHH